MLEPYNFYKTKFTKWYVIVIIGFKYEVILKGRKRIPHITWHLILWTLICKHYVVLATLCIRYCIKGCSGPFDKFIRSQSSRYISFFFNFFLTRKALHHFLSFPFKFSYFLSLIIPSERIQTKQFISLLFDWQNLADGNQLKKESFCCWERSKGWLALFVGCGWPDALPCRSEGAHSLQHCRSVLM